jgi:hypothetical protein
MTLPNALKIEWRPEARAAVRRLDRATAMHVFEACSDTLALALGT